MLALAPTSTCECLPRPALTLVLPLISMLWRHEPSATDHADAPFDDELFRHFRDGLLERLPLGVRVRLSPGRHDRAGAHGVDAHASLGGVQRGAPRQLQDRTCDMHGVVRALDLDA